MNTQKENRVPCGESPAHSSQNRGKKGVKNQTQFIAGVLVGAALFSGGSVLAAEQLRVQRSNQKFYLDGEPVNIEAYNINGSNYMRMGDLSQMVGFELSYDSATNSVYIGKRPVKELSPEGAIKLPEGDAKLNLKEGDKILCDDGYVYEITDMSRYDYSIFLGGPLPDLPTPTCDWSRYPTLELPKVEARHFYSAGSHELFIRNLYETRRMQYTLYNAMGAQPLAWENGKCIANFHLSIPAELDEQTQAFWPWRDSELTKFANNRPVSNYYIEAWDYYSDGIFQHTRYCLA